jgi:hypothetical protein
MKTSSVMHFIFTYSLTLFAHVGSKLVPLFGLYFDHFDLN